MYFPLLINWGFTGELLKNLEDFLSGLGVRLNFWFFKSISWIRFRFRLGNFLCDPIILSWFEESWRKTKRFLSSFDKDEVNCGIIEDFRLFEWGGF